MFLTFGPPKPYVSIYFVLIIYYINTIILLHLSCTFRYVSFCRIIYLKNGLDILCEYRLEYLFLFLMLLGTTRELCLLRLFCFLGKFDPAKCKVKTIRFSS